MPPARTTPAFAAILAFVGAASSIVLGSYPCSAQQLEATRPPPNSSKALPYLQKEAIDFRVILAPPPSVQSIEDKTDQFVELALQKEDDEVRWQTANLDSDYVFPRFSEALGEPLERSHLPFTVHLLNRAIRDVASSTFAAKDAFRRPRPFQRIQLTRVCGEASAPTPEEHPTSGSSYPSGHSAYGWTVGLILAEVAPDRASQLLARSADYAQSRLICGMHFPTDVEAGRALAVAVVERLQTSPTFRHDLICARAEVSGRAVAKSCRLK